MTLRVAPRAGMCLEGGNPSDLNWISRNHWLQSRPGPSLICFSWKNPSPVTLSERSYLPFGKLLPADYPSGNKTTVISITKCVLLISLKLKWKLQFPSINVIDRRILHLHNGITIFSTISILSTVCGMPMTVIQVNSNYLKITISIGWLRIFFYIWKDFVRAQ